MPGNRLSYIHTNGQGFNYGLAVNYSYNYDEMGRVTSITDSGRNYSAALTNDWNGNITRAVETWTGVGSATSNFTYDNENRLTAYTIGGAGFGADHYYDGYNRLIKTEATIGVNTQKFQHIYSGTKHIGSKEVTNPLNPVNGKVWRWGAGPGQGWDVYQEVMETPQWSSASANIYFPVNDERSMARRTYDANRNAGDTTEQSYYTEWYYVNGGLVPTRSALGQIPSELFSAYNITLDADRSTTPYTDHALNLVQTDMEYEVTRVKSPVLGRDLNAMGRGDGSYYPNGGNDNCGGSLVISNLKEPFLGIVSTGFGNSVNNRETKCDRPAEFPQDQYPNWRPFNALDCCPWDCKCGCERSGTFGCCTYTPIAKCPISATVSGEAGEVGPIERITDRSVLSASIPIPRERKAFAQVYFKWLRRLIWSMGWPGMPNVGAETGAKGASQDDQIQEYNVNDNWTQWEVKAAWRRICGSSGGSIDPAVLQCAPGDLHNCFRKICSGEVSVNIVADCAKASEATSMTSPLPCDLDTEQFTIYSCKKSASHENPRIIDLAETLLHEMMHVALCCATGDGWGCAGTESNIHACVERCLSKLHIGSEGHAKQSNKLHCNCCEEVAGKCCFSDSAFDCAKKKREDENRKRKDNRPPC